MVALSALLVGCTAQTVALTDPGTTRGTTPGQVTRSQVTRSQVTGRQMVQHPAKGPRHRAVVSHQRIGRSRDGRPIIAWQIGDPRSRHRVVLIAAMHGNELAARHILWTLRDGPPVTGADIWLVPTYNPDGAALHQRCNAANVDLNRNFPTSWRPQYGSCSAGPRPESAPETRAAVRFLNRINPDRIVSFHQPFHAVDIQGFKARPWGRRVARLLGIPLRHFDCSGTCHGTLTQWFNKNHRGSALTVELGPSPTWRYLNGYAPRRLLRAVGAAYR
ncbi:MAG: M14 family zinc carboxypeptidase [Nocardioidaceae bacterium]